MDLEQALTQLSDEDRFGGLAARCRGLQAQGNCQARRKNGELLQNTSQPGPYPS